MKRLAILFFVVMLLLCGCKDIPTDTTAVTEPTIETIPPEPETTVSDVEGELGIYEPDAELEELTHGAVRRYLLPEGDHYAIRAMGKALVLFSGTEETILTCLRDDMEPVSVTLTDVLLASDGPGCSVAENGVVYYDDIYNEMVVLDDHLKELRRLAMPVDMGCIPVFSSDLDRAFYFDRDGCLRVLDTTSGISRALTDEKRGDPKVLASHFDDSLLECQISVGDGTERLLIDAQTGALEFRTAEPLDLSTKDGWYFVPWSEIHGTSYIFGELEGERSCFVHGKEGAVVPFSDHCSVAVVSAGAEGCGISLYDLTEGPVVSHVTVPGCDPVDLVMDDRLDWVWILDRTREGAQSLYGWDPSVTGAQAEESCVTPYFTAVSPDTEGLDRIAQEARELSDRYGVRVQVYQAAVSDQPSDYIFTPEYQVPVYDHYLGVLDEQLALYPQELLKRLGKSSGNGRLTISLVRSITGNGDLGALSSKVGVQYWKGGSAYLTMTMGEGSIQSFHHELFHAIDTYILAETKAYDFWGSLNPDGFSYDMDEVKNSFRDPAQYLTGEERAFVDTYSMSYPKEDRATIMEYAVQEGRAEVFVSETMQKKLRTLCRGIRSAFGLGDHSEALVWEQYLDSPL